MVTCSFIHAADLHLDTPFVGLTGTAPELARKLRDASLEAFDGLVRAAIDARVDFVVLAGDIHDGAVRGVRAQLRLLAGLKRLDAAGIHTFIAHGNHDPVEEGWSAIDSWPERVHVFPTDAVASVPLDLALGRVTVHGISYRRREQVESLVPRFTRPTDGGLHVAVLHANVGGDGAHAAYSPCSVADLVAAGFDYWALGHIHRAAVLRPHTPRIVYPGNLQGRSFKPSERGPKGALLVTYRDGVWHDRALNLAPCRFDEFQVSIGGFDELPGLVDALTRQAMALARDPAARTCIVRATLNGRGPLAVTLRDALQSGDLLLALRDAAPAAVHWASIHNDTRSPIDVAARRGRDDLEGAVIEAADVFHATPERLRAALSASGRAGRAVLGDIDDETLKTLLDRALDRALGLVRNGEDA